MSSSALTVMNCAKISGRKKEKAQLGEDRLL